MNILKYTIKNNSEILKEFEVDPEKGLKTEEAKKLLEHYGRNEISGEVMRWWYILLRQFKSPFIYLLVGATFLAFLLRETIDGLMILLFLVINTSLGFYQEYRSEKTLQLLKQYVVSYVKVLRQGKIVAVRSEEVVPGDIIILETGDKIPADIRFIETVNVIVDESVLTGESISICKVSDILKEEAKEYYQGLNLGFSGTIVLNGKAKGVVLATGRETATGKIFRLTIETRHVSNFEKGIAGFSRFILKLVGVALLFVFLANVFLKKGDIGLGELALFFIALTVSVIPEALPVVITFSLSRGAQHLAKQKVVVRRLSAVEDMGGIEVLCTDKTGTLTENSLTVANIYSKSPQETLLYANLSASSSAEEKKIEPFDVALWKKLSQTQKYLIRKYTRILEIPFNPTTRRDSVLIKNKNAMELITRGAPENILKLCSNLVESEKEAIEQWISQEGKQGRRVLAVAKKQSKGQMASADTVDLEKEESGFAFIGIISFVDPIKPSSFKAVQDAVKLGVKIKIITGDSREVAGAVAYQIGLVASPDDVITAAELENLSAPEKEKTLEQYTVFARVSPEEKYAIIQSLQKKYEVGFLGEGINDAPALKIAGVSLVVDSAADIAREAADIVLLSKNLKVILDGIREGREVFANTTKYIRATLASNFGNFFAVAIASLWIDFLPMLPLQILLVNLLSDFPMIAISTDTIEEKELLSPKKYNVKGIVLLATILGIVSAVFDFIFFGLFYRISPGVLQTNWFIGSILTELVFIFSIRTRSCFLKTSRPSTPLILLVIIAFAATIALPFLALGQKIFSFVQPTSYHLFLILSVVAIYFIFSEAVKLLYYKTFDHPQIKKQA